MKFQNHYNREDFPDRGYEKNDQPSETVPDQSLTVRELVYRFTHNMDLSLAGLNRSYDEDGELNVPPNWNQLDLSEKMQWLDERKKEAKEEMEKYNAKRNKELADEQEAEIQRRVEEKLKANADAIRGGANNILKKPEGLEGGE